MYGSQCCLVSLQSGHVRSFYITLWGLGETGREENCYDIAEANFLGKIMGLSCQPPYQIIWMSPVGMFCVRSSGAVELWRVNQIIIIFIVITASSCQQAGNTLIPP